MELSKFPPSLQNSTCPGEVALGLLHLALKLAWRELRLKGGAS
jgi:hypothetical protein